MMSEQESLWQRAYSLRDAESELEKESALKQLISDLCEKGRGDADVHLLLGWLGYHFPCNATHNIDVERELLLSLQSDPHNITAHLYLGHFAFDHGNYDLALKHLRDIDRSKYEQADQLWRSMKIRELILCCRLYLEPHEVAPDEVVSHAQSLADAGIEHGAIPSELANCLFKTRERLRALWGEQSLLRVAGRLRKALGEVARADLLDKELGQLL